MEVENPTGKVTIPSVATSAYTKKQCKRHTKIEIEVDTKSMPINEVKMDKHLQ